MKYHYSYGRFAYCVIRERRPPAGPARRSRVRPGPVAYTRFERHAPPLPGRVQPWWTEDRCQSGSLAGAAYLLHSNAGVLSGAQQRQKRCVAYKGKSSAYRPTLSTGGDRESVA